MYRMLPIGIKWSLFIREKLNSVSCATLVLSSQRDQPEKQCHQLGPTLLPASPLYFLNNIHNYTKCSHWKDFLFNLISARRPTESHSLNMSRFRGQESFSLEIYCMWKTDCIHGIVFQQCNSVFVGESLHPPSPGKRGMLKTASVLEKWSWTFNWLS